MADTMTKLAEGACPTGGLSTVYTAGAKVSILSIDISNPTVSTQNVQLTLKGRTLFQVDMPTQGGVSWRGPQVMEAAETIQIDCDSASCEYSISGVVIT